MHTLKIYFSFWQASIIGAFAQSNEGDATPNIRGDLCDGTMEPCSYKRSTCPEDALDVRLYGLLIWLIAYMLYFCLYMYKQIYAIYIVLTCKCNFLNVCKQV